MDREPENDKEPRRIFILKPDIALSKDLNLRADSNAAKKERLFAFRIIDCVSQSVEEHIFWLNDQIMKLHERICELEEKHIKNLYKCQQLEEQITKLTDEHQDYPRVIRNQLIQISDLNRKINHLHNQIFEERRLMKEETNSWLIRFEKNLEEHANRNLDFMQQMSVYKKQCKVLLRTIENMKKRDLELSGYKDREIKELNDALDRLVKDFAHNQSKFVVLRWKYENLKQGRKKYSGK